VSSPAAATASRLEATSHRHRRAAGEGVGWESRSARFSLPRRLKATATKSAQGRLRGLPTSRLRTEPILTKGVRWELACKATRRRQLNADSCSLAVESFDTCVDFRESLPPADADIELIKRLSLVPRKADPSEVAAAVAYLASDEARHVNGATLAIDAGMVVS